MGLEVFAIIPARGGSKRVPRKNLKPILGEPLIVRAIRSAKAATSISRTIVSTEDDEIGELSRRYDAEVIVRPHELATDTASTEVVLLHVLETLERSGEPLPAYVLTLEPTSPLRTPELLDACVELAIARDADSVVTVVETRDLYGRLDGDRFAFLASTRAPRKDREPLYREVGVAYVTRTGWLREHRSVIGDRLHALVVPEERAADINTTFDLVVAEAALAALEEGRIAG
jgi:CMP-N,N'-diacetyllegionaminic acid synthase